ncbi:MAG: hypothetical protein KTR16_05705 [Acidiferrobacterales bacterium]|nr:hypothetical protein [Acidiferrobacterales bacterium]
MSGLIGECKATNLAQLDDSEFLARFKVIKAHDDVTERVESVQRFMRELDLQYPIVLKPDFGQRGMDVAVIRSEKQVEEYLGQVKAEVILQEHVDGEEFGIFYYRLPKQDSGKIFSITEKTFPVLVGNGRKTLEQLIFENPRTHYMAKFLLELHDQKLNMVLADKEPFKVVEIGSHCRGSVFLDGSKNISLELEERIDVISQKLNGFYFGRYDIRVPNKENLQAGQSFKILEVNGVTSESTNIYDPKNSVLDAYKILFKQWKLAFEIGDQNISLGTEKVSIIGLIRHLRKTYY